MAIIKARHQPFFVWFFRNYSKLMIRMHFNQVRFHGTFDDHGLPVLLLGNHFSWWDGFIANLLNIKIFHRKFHVMMLEEQLKDRMFLNKAGAYSIRKGSRSVKESMDYTLELLGDAKNLVVLYPQGEFQSLSQYPVKFEPGTSRILDGITGSIHLVLYVALVDYFENRKPTLNIYYGQFEEKVIHQEHDLEYLYNRFLADCIKLQVPVR